MVKHIGIVGGLSYLSTITYYQQICSRFSQLEGGLNSPQISIRSLNLQEMVDTFSSHEPDNWDKVAEIIVSALHDLKRSGADFAAIATNTPHNAYDQIRKNSPLELVSIMEATATKIQKDGFSKVGLLGTKPTMEYGFFQRAFQEYDIKIIIPTAKQRTIIDRIIWKELTCNLIHSKSRRAYQEIINQLQERGAQGIILGCTEIPLLIHPQDCELKTYDTAKLHARAILDYALKP